jgi:hypothetical protein
MTDIDHIISREAIGAVYNYKGYKLVFPRYFAVLLPDGGLTQDMETLIEYGFDTKRLAWKRGLYASVHGNTWAMRRDVLDAIGGYSEKHCTYGFHAGRGKGEDCYFNTSWNHWATPRGIKAELGPKIYMFPVGRYHSKGDTNPMGLFHKLSYDPVPQPMMEQ